MLSESIYNKEKSSDDICKSYESEESWYILNHFRNGILPPSNLMLPPSVAKLIKLGPEKMSGERILYHICQITDCCSRSVNFLIYTAHHVVTKPVCFLERICFFIVQSPSSCFNRKYKDYVYRNILVQEYLKK